MPLPVDIETSMSGMIQVLTQIRSLWCLLDSLYALQYLGEVWQPGISFPARLLGS